MTGPGDVFRMADQIGHSLALGANALLKRAGIQVVMAGGGRPLSSFAGVPWTTVGSSGRSVKGSAAAYRCVETIASNAGSVPLTALDSEGEAVDDPFLYLWNKLPNPTLSARVMTEVMWWRLETRGEWLAYLDRGETGEGEPTGIWPLYGFSVEPIVTGSARRGEPGSLVGFRIQREGRAAALLPQEVLWVRYPDPDDPWGCLPPLHAATFALELDAYAQQYQVGQFVNADAPSGVLYLGDVDDGTHRDVEANIAARHSGGGNAGRTLILSGPSPAKYDRFSLSPAEISYLDTRTRNTDEIMLAFGIPHDYLLGGATYENRAASRQTLWMDTIVPKLDLVAAEIDRQVWPDTDLTGVFNTSGVKALQENEDAKAARVRSLVMADIATLNEGRVAIGLDPAPWGEVTWSEHKAAATFGPVPVPSAEPRFTVLQGRVVPEIRAKQPRNWNSREVLSFYRKWEPVGRKAVAILAAEQEQRVLDSLDRLMGPNRSRRSKGWETRAEIDDIFDPNIEKQATIEALGGWVVDTGVSAANGTGDRLAIEDIDDATVTGAMRRRTLILANSVTETTRDVLQSQVLEQGVAAGESVDQLADRVRGTFETLSTSRARTIARTETVGAFNESSLITASRSGLLVGKRWLSTFDTRTRPEHRSLHGDEVTISDSFSNGCRYPGDPYGRASTTVNCRCTLQWVFEDEDLNDDAPEPPEDWRTAEPDGQDDPEWEAWPDA